MLYSHFNSFQCCASQVWPLEVFVVLTAFSCKDRLFECIPCATLEHNRIQSVDNHITHSAAPCAALSPIHSLWNVLILAFVFFSFLPPLYLTGFLLLTVIFMCWFVLINQFYFYSHFRNKLSLLYKRVLIFLPADLESTVEWCTVCTCSLWIN